MIENRTLAEVTIGESASLSRTVTQGDMDLFAVASGEVNLAHYAAAGPAGYPRVIADGMLGAGLISGVVAAKLPGPGATFLAHDLRFLKSIAIGDRLTATVTVLAKDPAGAELTLACRCVDQAAEAAGLDIGAFRLVDAPHSEAAAAEAVALVRRGEAALLMKGSLHTDELLHAVLSPDCGLRTGRGLSHVYLMDVPAYPRPLLLTDAAVNIAPDLERKRDIVQNAVDLAHVMGVETPRVAVLSAVETINPKMPSTLDAAALCKMADRGQITGALVDGPLAFDNAVSPDAARTKGIVSPVAGLADILVAPDLEAGNMLAKQLTFMAGADAAGVVLGAKAPIILTSRADSERTRLASCAVAARLAMRKEA